MMGFSSDIMHAIVEKELKRHYPSSEGWTLQPGPVKVDGDELYSFVKRVGGKNEVVFVGVSLGKTIGGALIRELTAKLSSRAAARSVSHLALIVPQDSDVRNVPPPVTVSRMRAFRYEGDDLIWLKHHTRRS
ncbi:MAG TPA: hypothetical protein VMC42_05030 [Methanoregulaceae archaeon]|nr:hypothetical protein [Methanoregulaceae archaeon]